MGMSRLIFFSFSSSSFLLPLRLPPTASNYLSHHHHPLLYSLILFCDASYSNPGIKRYCRLPPKTYHSPIIPPTQPTARAQTASYDPNHWARLAARISLQFTVCKSISLQLPVNKIDTTHSNSHKAQSFCFNHLSRYFSFYLCFSFPYGRFDVKAFLQFLLAKSNDHLQNRINKP